MKRIILVLLLVFFTFSFLQAQGDAGYSEEYKNTSPIIKFFKMGKSEMTTIAPVNALGREINDLYAFISWIGVGILTLIVFLFIIIIFRFREKRTLNKQKTKKSLKVVPEMGKPHKGSLILEILWTVIPTIIIIIIAIPTIQLIFKIENFPNFDEKKKIVYQFDKEDDQVYDKYLKVNVIGHQWWWEFEYIGMYSLEDGKEKFTPIEKVTAGEARFPVNVPILFQVNSEDVIHSFWAPRLGGKIDANPGLNNHVSFVFEEEGYFWGHCVEYCGASHALMRLNLVGVSQQEFEDWLNWGKGEAVAVSESAKRGKELMTSCLACHTMNGLNDFVPRKKKYETALLDFYEQKKIYDKALKNWKDTPEAEYEGHFEKYKYKPKPPLKPEYYKGFMITLAPDLTDVAIKKRAIAGIKESSKEILVEWVSDPPQMKPEIRGTVVPRMPVYKNIYSKKQIEDIVEFLLTVEYSQSPKPETLKVK